ncbi:endo-1,4-beta-xylanase [Streptomyces sp. JJ36]|nr:endo-1,4-beta-xylanase [Streptomyces sp. JJ36]
MRPPRSNRPAAVSGRTGSVRGPRGPRGPRGTLGVRRAGRRLHRTAVTLATAAATGLAALAGAAPAQAADAPLRDLAEAKGVYIGNALAAGKLDGNARYRQIAGQEFNWVTAENAMKWGVLEPSRGNYDWSGADRIMEFAAANGQQVRGHTLVWHSQAPGWLENGGFPAAELRGLMYDHIDTTMGRYQGRIAHWDVVNEAFNESGGFRDSFWYRTLGESYIADAFRRARQADPSADLYINDYNVEGVNAKSTAMYNLVRDLKAQGVPIDGVGLQAHLITGQVPSSLQQNIQRFADLGVDVAITELDIRMNLPADAGKLAQQARDYRTVVEACLAVSRCVGVTGWGISDADSWVPDVFEGQGAATMYDSGYNPKPAYDAVAQALGGTGDDDDDPPGNGDGDGCTADYTVASQWNTGFTGNVAITCSGGSLNGWTVSWDFPAGQRLSQAWNAGCTQSGARVTCTNAGWNGTVPDGGSVSFGFNAEWSGSNPSPDTVTVS